MRTDFLVKENVFLNKWVFDDAERAFYCKKPLSAAASSLSNEFAKVRQQIRNQLESVEGSNFDVSEITNRLNKLELENAELKNLVKVLEARVAQFENGAAASKPASTPAPAAAAPAPAASKKDDDDFDLFADDDEEESEEKKRITEERLKAYNAKKSKKEAIIAKSTIIMDVKPWDDETDLAKLEESVRSIQMDGLTWGSSKLLPVAYGVKKLQITLVIEDDKVSTELLEEKITEFEDYVQSVDIVSFNKI